MDSSSSLASSAVDRLLKKTVVHKSSGTPPSPVPNSFGSTFTETFTYRPNGQLASLVTDLGNDGSTDFITRYQYDNQGREVLEQILAPTGDGFGRFSRMNASLYTPGKSLEHLLFSYELSENKLVLGNSRGRTQEYSYETLFPEYRLRPGGPNTSLLVSLKTFDRDDNLTQQVFGGVSSALAPEYVDTVGPADIVGRFSSETNYTYKANGERASRTDYEIDSDLYVEETFSGGLTVDENGKPIGEFLFDPDNPSFDYSFRYEFDRFGNRTDKRFEIGGTFGVYKDIVLQDAFVYNAQGQLLTERFPYGIPFNYTFNDQFASVGAESNFTYDNRGNLLSEVRRLAGAGDFGGTMPIELQKIYTYDNRNNRLSEEEVEFYTASGNERLRREQQFTYDADNNLLSESLSLVRSRFDGSIFENKREISRYTYDANNNLTSKITSDIGTDGNESRTGLERYRFDSRNNLLLETVIEIAPSGTRRTIKNNRYTFNYDSAGNLTRETSDFEADGTVEIVATYTYKGDRVTPPTPQPPTPQPPTDKSILTGTEKDDVLTGLNRKTLINGKGGNDVLTGGADIDTINGGNGRDRINGGGGDDKLLGGNGNDELNGGNGGDKLLGGNGNDQLNGENGDDKLLGGNGDDMLNGNSGQDRLLGGIGSDELNGGNGRDTLIGGIGKDRLLGGNGDDRLKGNQGIDWLSGGNGDDFIEGGTGRDELRGDAGRDRLLGGDGDDLLIGGSGDDVLIGGAGRDFLEGGVGRDIFWIRLGEGGDVIADFGPTDCLRFGSGVQRQDLTITESNITLTRTGEVLVSFTGVDPTTLSAAQLGC